MAVATADSSPISLLTPEEEEILVSTLGPRCMTLSTAVVQLHYTTPPEYSDWIYGCCGVATFTRDSSRRSYFIQIYDVENREKLFEQEIYENFVYHVDNNSFQQFESEEAIVGLNFAHEEEARRFHESIEGYLRKRNKRKEAPREPQHENTAPTSVPRIPKVKLQDRRGNEKVPKLITKNDIGPPQDFRHVQHVGMAPPLGGDGTPRTLDNDTLLSYIIEMMNENTPMNSNTLQDPKMKEMIMNHIEEKGGIWKVYKKLKRNKSRAKSTPTSPHPDEQPRTTSVKVHRPTPGPPLPQRSSLQPPHGPPSPTSTPGPVPPRSPSPSRLSPHPHPLSPHRPSSPYSSPQTPPPLPSQSRPSNRAPLGPTPQGKVVRKAPQARGAPPPPQQPHPQVLAEQSCSPPPPPVFPTSPSEHSGSSRSALLDQIRNPQIKLKTVASKAESPTVLSPTAECSSNVILNSLAKALEHRGRACRGTSEDTSEESTTDEEYEDEWD